MFNEKFKETLAHEGVVSIVSWDGKQANVTNTWNSYMQMAGDDKLLIPAAGMKSTEADVATNNKVKLTFGSKEVEGTKGMGAGFHVEGTAAFAQEGAEFELMKAKFPWLREVLIVTVSTVEQTI